uniref:Putative ovule protein n=1 Tax=Solanum chacoense TaxID=4108 RepID=A0A0V0H8N3_SOLCH
MENLMFRIALQHKCIHLLISFLQFSNPRSQSTYIILCSASFTRKMQYKKKSTSTGIFLKKRQQE